LKKKVILVGASTGGPSQIKEMLCAITHLPCTIIIVQHMQEDILPFFIKDLKDSLEHKVFSTPTENIFDEPSVIVCSQSSVLKKSAKHYNIIADSQNQVYTPDINKLFNSFVFYAEDFDIKIIIMTGIGNDGVDGAIKLKAKGAKVIAQDEKSSPVYGMPRVAVESGIVNEVKSIGELIECFRSLRWGS